MKQHRWILVLFLFGLFLLLRAPCRAVYAGDKAETHIRFHWAFEAMVGPDSGPKLVSITRDTALQTGDRIKMMIELQKKCFVYLFYRNSKDEWDLLFPYALDQFEKDYDIGEKYYIPRGDMWFELDKQFGRETFYLLAADRRFTKLETLYDEYSAAPDSKKKGLGQQILRKIHFIKKRRRKLTTYAERPVPIGGTMRSAGAAVQEGMPDLGAVAIEVSAGNFYGRTFTIAHR